MKVEKKKPKGFQKGHKLSVGNKGNTKSDKYKDRFISSAIEAALLKGIRDKKTGNIVKKIELLANRLVQTAIFGDAADSTRAIKEIIDRMEGKPLQAVEHSGPNKQPMQMIHTPMTAAEAARVFQAAIRRSRGEEE